MSDENIWVKNKNYIYALLIFIAGIVSTMVLITITNFEIVQIVNKVLNFGVVFGAWMLYKFLFNRTSFKTDENIATNPIAVAIDGFGFIVAVAIAITL
jgi:hypothetical protein